MALCKIKICPGEYYSFAKKIQFTSGEIKMTASWLPTLKPHSIFYALYWRQKLKSNKSLKIKKKKN